MVKMFYRDAKAAIVCFDITNKSSWEGLRSWISELREVEEVFLIPISLLGYMMFLTKKQRFFHQ